MSMGFSVPGVPDDNEWLQWPAYEPVVKNFTWKYGKTPGSTYFFVASSVVGYLAVVYGTRSLMQYRQKGFWLGPLPAIHNLILCIGSLAMFLGAAQASYVDAHETQWLWGAEGKYRWLFCLPLNTRAQGRVFFWSYVYYLSKFYELLDTLLLVLKKKPLSVLHVYHHALVIVMCYLWLQERQSLQTIGLLTNTGIHVVMYFYYFMHSIGRPPPWRKFVTNSQIIQFLFSFLASLPMLRWHFQGPGCSGFNAWLFNVGFNLSLLLLFLNFHRKQYGAGKPAVAGGSSRRSKRD
eukprot:jgi/Mesen1/5001/ME000025S04401